MGIDLPAARFLAGEARRGVAFGRMLTLGHQGIYIDPAEYEPLARALGFPVGPAEYADDFFRALGATAIDVMDCSAYEGANVIHDLNRPVASDLQGKYDCVLDGGALEHVFNLPTALQSCMEMVKLGGHFIAAAPANDYFGHGFYQFSPELFYSALSPANGFAVERLLICDRDRWYAVRKPEEVRTRVELSTDRPTLLFVSARRIAMREIFQEWPQQSDYLPRWNPAAGGGPAPSRRSLAAPLIKVFPWLSALRERWRSRRRRRQCSLRNREWFTPVDVDPFSR